MKSFAWCKVWDSWWTSRSHSELDGVALAVGLRLLSVANASPIRGSILTPTGVPRSTAAIAREVRFSETQTQQAIDALVACGTLARNDSGALFFPEFLRYQEDPSTERHRRKRAIELERQREMERENHVNVTDRGQRTEDRGQKKEEEKEEISSPSGTRPPEDRTDAEPRQVELVRNEPTRIARRTGPTLVELSEIWNRATKRLPKVRTSTPGRERHLRARHRPERTAEWWLGLFARLDASDFAAGGGWAGLDWLLKSEENIAKVLEGKYDNREDTTKMSRNDKYWAEMRAAELAAQQPGALALAPEPDPWAHWKRKEEVG